MLSLFLSNQPRRVPPPAQPTRTMNYELLIDDKSIALTEEDYNEIERLLQWPEDLAEYDRSNAPTTLTEIGF